MFFAWSSSKGNEDKNAMKYGIKTDTHFTAVNSTCITVWPTAMRCTGCKWSVIRGEVRCEHRAHHFEFKVVVVVIRAAS